MIYAPEIDYLTYQERAHEWDGFEGYDVFLNYMSESALIRFHGVKHAL